MKFNQYIIESFSKPINALADKPTMSAKELKEWFDSNSTNEIKNSINGIVKLLDSVDGAKNIGCRAYKHFGDNVEDFICALADMTITAQGNVDEIRGMINKTSEAAIAAQNSAEIAMMYAKSAMDIANKMNWLVLIDPESGEEMGIQEILYNLYYRISVVDEVTCDKWDTADWMCSTFDGINFTCQKFDTNNIFNLQG